MFSNPQQGLETSHVKWLQVHMNRLYVGYYNVLQFEGWVAMLYNESYPPAMT